MTTTTTQHSTTATAPATTATASSTPTITRPIHPCVISNHDYSRSIEMSTWAYLHPSSSMSVSSQRYPSLVTASSNSMCVYTICPHDHHPDDNTRTGKDHPSSTTLQFVPSNLPAILSHLAGTIVALSTIPSPASSSVSPDALLIGFAGHPRCVVLTVVVDDDHEEYQYHQSHNSNNHIMKWQVASLLDMSHRMMDYSLGATTIYEQDMVLTTPYRHYQQQLHDTTTTTTTTSTNHMAAAILGGGMALAILTFSHVPTPSGTTTTTIMAHEPYMVPLATLPLSQYHHNHHGQMSSSSQLDHHHHSKTSTTTTTMNDPTTTAASSAAAMTTTTTANNNNMKSVVPTGFGDILDALFLNGYRTEPVLVLLHSTPKHGKISTHRYQNQQHHHSHCYYFCTALSISTVHQRTAILWSVPIFPMDVLYLSALPPPPTTTTASSTLDSNSTGHHHHTNSFVLVSNNTITFMSSMDGSIQQCIAVNGWAGATSTSAPATTTTTTSRLDPHTHHHHPVSSNPIMKLSIQLDGCQMTWITDTFGLLILRYGQVYTIQYISQVWNIIPLGQQLTGIGEIATCDSGCWGWTAPSSSSAVFRDGYVLAGSRLGNSLWIHVSLDMVTIPTQVEHLLQLHMNRDGASQETAKPTIVSSSTSDDVDEILRMEDEALYGSGYVREDGTTHPDVIPLSDDDNDDAGVDRMNNITNDLHLRRSRQNVVADNLMTVVRTFTPVDCIVNVGPLGPSCSGPISKAPLYLLQSNRNNVDDDDDTNMEQATPPVNMNHSSDNDENDGTIYGAVAEIYPSGYGSSGGIAYMTVPGRDDRMIVSETDCLQNECIFTLSYHGIALLGMSNTTGNSGGIRILKQQVNSGTKSTGEMNEIGFSEWCSDAVDIGSSNTTTFGDVFQSTLLCAGEFAFGQRVVLVVKSRDDIETSVIVAKYNTTNEKIEMMRHHRIDLPQGHLMASTATVSNVCPIVETSEDSTGASFGCVWSNGDATLFTINMDGNIITSWIEGTDAARDAIIKQEMDVDDEDDDDTEAKEIEKFYSDKCIVAVDVFRAPVQAFEIQSTRMAEAEAMTLDAMDTTNTVDNMTSSTPLDETTWHITYDAEDEELYSLGANKSNPDFNRSSRFEPSVDPFVDNSSASGDEMATAVYFAVCRRLGNVDIYAATAPNTLLWTIRGTNLGLPFLTAENGTSFGTLGEQRFRLPRSHCIAVTEIRFFVCGPDSKDTISSAHPSENLCLGIVTSEGDMYLYTWSNRFDSMSISPIFRRIPLRSVARTSQEQLRHRAKLSRKGVLGKELDGASVERNVLHRFNDLSGQNGLFAALARPQWFVCERGQIVALDHRMRHAAPAGCSMQPIKSFGSIRFLSEIAIGRPAFQKDTCGYITVHERLGRVGSQRLTIYKGLSDVFESNGILLGNGCCMEKVMLGVTVRRIVFIDDDTISSGDHPLYAVLVSREVEIDQSDLNTDGLSDIERQIKQQEREAIKIQKQVEADLGGFDIESDWVESIEREDAFHIQTDLGGAPPICKSIYSLWIIDAANKWMVIDSYQLDEFEHGIDLKMLYLTEFQDETGGTTAPGYDPKSDDAAPAVRKRLFIALGTGIVNQDGEDVNSKGRVLLFNIKRSLPPAGSSTLHSSSAPFAELTLAYEKTMFHGPVTTLSCLVSDNDKRRLVIGAGSDINIEMWNEPQSKLIQVGFFRATMHILNIIHFKNFLLLSDAYDTISLLVYRESDKSLTLLAKDYDPIPVYATGIMTRGAAMTFVCHDDRQNLQFFQYAPGEAAARGGNKLVCRADFHLGKQSTSFRTHYCRPSLYVHSATPASTLSALKQQDTLFGRQDDDQRIGVNFGTSDGSVISIIPLSEPIYWRLMALQSVMSNALESDCVLNHRAWRLYRRSIRRGGCRNNDRKKGVIDGDLILKYPDLPVTQQEDLASAIGSTVELISDNLLEALCSSMIL